MSITLTIAIATGAAVAGFIFSRVLDTRTIREICESYEVIIKSIRKYHAAREKAIIKAYNRSQIEKATRPEARKPRNADEAFFSDIASWSIDTNDNDFFGGF